MAETKTVEQLADEVKALLETSRTETKKIADQALEEAKKSGTLAEETKGKADELLTKTNTLTETLARLEQRMVKPGGGAEEVKTFGAQFIESDKFKAFSEKGMSGSVRVEMKATTTATAGTNWSQRDTDVVQLPQRRMVVRDLLNVVPTTSGSIDYAAQVTRTNNAAVVVEGATKPSSLYEWAQRNAPVRTIAHLTKITRQALDDAVQLQGEIDSEMRYGLMLAEEGELLTGDGTGQHLNGLIPQATAYAAAIAIDGVTDIDQLRLALLQAELSLYPADGIVMHPTSWAMIELTKDAQGRYIWANPLQLAGPTLWGKAVVPTQAMTSGKFLTGAFKLQTLYDRMQPEVLISSENVDDFEKNLYTMRCEERIALAVKRALALIYGTFVQ